jgi:hypothetical protein
MRCFEGAPLTGVARNAVSRLSGLADRWPNCSAKLSWSAAMLLKGEVF